jgi:hypothetical protein
MSFAPQRALRLLASAAIVSLVAASAHTEPSSWSLPDEPTPASAAAPPLAYAAIQEPGLPREADEADRKAADRLAPETRPSADLSAIRAGLELARKGDASGADAIRAALDDRAARALLDWVLIRGGVLGFERVADFLRESPDWPAGSRALRRESRRAHQPPTAAIVERAFSRHPAPLRDRTQATRAALAFKADGLETATGRCAATLVRERWREDNLRSAYVEPRSSTHSRRAESRVHASA